MSPQAFPNSQINERDKERLSDFSRREARVKLWRIRWLRRFSIAVALGGTIPAILWVARNVHLLVSQHAALGMHSIAQLVFNSNGGWEVGTYLFAAAIVAGGIVPLFEHFGEAEEKWTRIRDAGLIPRYDPFRDDRPTDSELFNIYASKVAFRSKDDSPETGFLVPGVPIYFVISPQAGFDVFLKSSPNTRTRDAFEDSVLSLDAANLGLDWFGFSRWWLSTKREQWFGWASEPCIRCTDAPRFENSRCFVNVIDCPYEKYLITESVVNLTAGTRLPDMRRLFEGEHWESNKVDLLDFQEARKRFSMLVSVAALVTTDDQFVILQRRSRRVAQGSGVITTTCNGFANWKRDYSRFAEPDLRHTALRELYEETGIPKEKLRSTDNSFIGAAFNLLHGRDLNFYAHFTTSLTHHEVSERLRHAGSRWEVASLIFLPLSKISDDGLSLLKPLDGLQSECSRHLRGALFALAKSGRLKQIKQHAAQETPR